MSRARTFIILGSGLLPLLVLVAAATAWHLAIEVFDIPPYIVPRPLSVLESLRTMRVELTEATVRTAIAAVSGLAVSTVVGTAVAFAFAQSVVIRRAFYPYAILFQTIPVIAIAPLIILTFGRGFHSVTLVAVVISLFPVVTNTTTGLLQIDSQLHELFRLHGATWWQTHWKLRLPSALPWMISGIRIAGGVAVVGAIVGEFFVGSSQPGLGAWIQRKTASADLPALYATIVASTSLGVGVFAALTWTGDAVLRRWFGTRLDGSPFQG
ncbi:MAG: ABC transporter permease [Fuerstiella sp.]|nr:ABC transporter permease [Fuerstiella sp.]